MGDFGREVEGVHYTYTFRPEDKLKNTPHQVTLDSFSLPRYKVTWFEYDTFLLDTGRPLQYIRLHRNPPGSKLLSTLVWEEIRPAYQQEPGKTEQGGFVN